MFVNSVVLFELKVSTRKRESFLSNCILLIKCKMLLSVDCKWFQFASLIQTLINANVPVVKFCLVIKSCVN